MAICSKFVVSKLYYCYYVSLVLNKGQFYHSANESEDYNFQLITFSKTNLYFCYNMFHQTNYLLNYYFCHQLSKKKKPSIIYSAIFFRDPVTHLMVMEMSL